MLDDHTDDRSDAQAPDVQEVIVELHATQCELDETVAKFTSAHADKKHLEAALKTRIRHSNANLDFEYKSLQVAFQDLATEALGFKPVGEETTSSLELTKFGDLLAEQEEDLEWLVHNAISPGTMNALAGPPKIGKSVLLRQLAVATGRLALHRVRDVPRRRQSVPIEHTARRGGHGANPATLEPSDADLPPRANAQGCRGGTGAPGCAGLYPRALRFKHRGDSGAGASDPARASASGLSNRTHERP